MVLGKLPVPGRPTIWVTVGQGPTALAVGAGRGCLDIFTLIYHFFPLSPSLWETARYRLEYCLKGPLSPKQPTDIDCNKGPLDPNNQPTNQPVYFGTSHRQRKKRKKDRREKKTPNDSQPHLIYLKFMFKAAHNNVPTYISDIISLTVVELSRYELRDRQNISTFSQQTTLFAKSCIPSSIINAWNNLDTQIQIMDNSESYPSFCYKLKKDFFLQLEYLIIFKGQA